MGGVGVAPIRPIIPRFPGLPPRTSSAAFGTAVAVSGASTFRNATPNNPLNSLAAPLTVMAWINPAGLTGIQRIISGSGSDGNGWGYGVLANGNQRYTTYGVTDYDQTVGATV